MTTPSLSTQSPARGALLAGRFLSGFAALFLAFDMTLKLAQLPEAIEATSQLGYPASVVFPIGLVQLVLPRR